MVRVGPWTVESVQHGPWRQCDRCGARHKEVWVCTVDADAVELGTVLDGKRTWRIGSKCGPTLILVSEKVWAEKTGPVMKTLHLLVRARRAIAAAVECKFESYFLPLIIERTNLLERGRGAHPAIAL